MRTLHAVPSLIPTPSNVRPSPAQPDFIYTPMTQEPGKSPDSQLPSKPAVSLALRTPPPSAGYTAFYMSGAV
jgi:hypothetical protein